MSTTLTVTDMACDGCETAIKEALEGVSGVTRVDADHESGTVIVEGDAATDAVVAAIDDAGYEAEA